MGVYGWQVRAGQPQPVVRMAYLLLGYGQVAFRLAL
jgi:hypothetical protein